MTKLLLKRTASSSVKRLPQPANKLMSELLPDTRQMLRAAAIDLLQPREQAITAILRKAGMKLD